VPFLFKGALLGRYKIDARRQSQKILILFLKYVKYMLTLFFFDIFTKSIGVAHKSTLVVIKVRKAVFNV